MRKRIRIGDLGRVAPAVLMAIALGVGLAGSAQALTVVEFTGTVERLSDDTSTFPPLFSPGDPYSATLTLDGSVPDTGAAPDRGFYTGAVVSYSLTVGGYSAAAMPPTSGVTVVDAVTGDEWRASFSGEGAPELLPGFTARTFTVGGLIDSTGSVFTDDSFQLPPSDLSVFDVRAFSLFFSNDDFRNIFVRGTIDGITVTEMSQPIPEPSAALTFGAGMLVVGAVMRRRPRAG